MQHFAKLLRTKRTGQTTSQHADAFSRQALRLWLCRTWEPHFPSEQNEPFKQRVLHVLTTNISSFYRINRIKTDVACFTETPAKKRRVQCVFGQGGRETIKILEQQIMTPSLDLFCICFIIIYLLFGVKLLNEINIGAYFSPPKLWYLPMRSDSLMLKMLHVIFTEASELKNSLSVMNRNTQILFIFLAPPSSPRVRH